TTLFRSERGDAHPYLITSADGQVLTADDQGTTLQDISLREAAADEHARWLLTTENGGTWSWVNEALAEALDVTGQSTEAGTSVGTWDSTGGQNQAWQLRSVAGPGGHDGHHGGHHGHHGHHGGHHGHHGGHHGHHGGHHGHPGHHGGHHGRSYVSTSPGAGRRTRPVGAATPLSSADARCHRGCPRTH